MSGAVLVAVDGDADVLRDLGRELRERYGRHYRVLTFTTPDDALASLKDLDDVALVLSGQWLSGMTGGELLSRVRRLHPHAKRGLLIAWGEWGDRETGEAIFEAIARGHIDHYVLRPLAAPDEVFHHAISNLLLEWTEARRTSPYTIHVVGESWSGRAYELRKVLGRCAIPHAFSLADSHEGRALIAEVGADGGLPLVVFPDGNVLRNPTDADIAVATGAPVDPERMEFDLVIVGAGPAGLSAAMYGASEGFGTLVVDEGGLGGQATSSSLIRNYLGFPRGVSGRRLAQQAYDQAWVFGAKFVFMQRAVDLERDGELTLTLSNGTRVHSRAVLLATGAAYHRLGVPGLEELSGAGVHYGGPASEAPGATDREVFVVGGGNSAGQAALYLARYARRVTLLVRADSLGAGMSHYLTREIAATPRLDVRLATEIVGGGGDGWLDHLVLRDRRTGEVETVPADGLFVMIGALPHTDWLPPEIRRDERGFVLTGADLDGCSWPIARTRLPLETSMPGVFAAGDARHDSVKRVASAVGEGSVAIQLLHRMFTAEGLRPRGRPQEPVTALGR
ncbi:FAD-dependent oxidoreductase [Amycolatopsis sp. FDAARGOS 1241]|uniref:FAD-dependent oxidoreductase n=1 Tax=Amycolatopsis sp. FDAARGOS 1241 TaxID=2778070 RepID=UPI001951520C|nr:FAD-dependent oxidoreductase [Amycolatopsis sp. FDAARGOS 1241]QRP49573.1 FAD-dependent oxidoreductase [Amycolatopsis sp. FDAARGOS 1241]